MKSCSPEQISLPILSHPDRYFSACSRNFGFCSTRSILPKNLDSRCLLIRPMPAPQSRQLSVPGAPSSSRKRPLRNLLEPSMSVLET